MMKINRAFAIVSGILVSIIALLSALESILRWFGSPTTWILDVSVYMLIWATFLGSSYTFQEGGHIAVDFVRESLGKRLGQGIHRLLSVAAYLCTLIFLVILGWCSFGFFKMAVITGKLTFAYIQIPIAWLYLAMIIGSAAMILTIIFIIGDLISGSKKYL